MFLNKRVGSKCLAALLGMGNSRLHNASRGCVDLLYGAFGFVPWFSLEPSWYWIFRSSLLWSLSPLTGEFFRPKNLPEVRRSQAVKRMKVDAYLMKLYQNAAGMLPTKPLVCIPLSNGFYDSFDCLHPTPNLRFQRGGQKASSAREDLQIAHEPSPNEGEICCLALN